MLSFLKNNLGLISALLASVLWGLNYVLFEKVMHRVNIFSLLIASSIKHSNAVVAGLVEISYPLFIIIFSFLILKETNIDFKTIIGGLLIIIGVVIISIK